MKHLIEIFEWGVEGEYEQAFFVSPIPVEKVYEALRKEPKYMFKPLFEETNYIGYLDSFSIVYDKLKEYGYEEILVGLNDGYISHLRKYIHISREVGIRLELVITSSEAKKECEISSDRIEFAR